MLIEKSLRNRYFLLTVFHEKTFISTMSLLIIIRLPHETEASWEEREKKTFNEILNARKFFMNQWWICFHFDNPCAYFKFKKWISIWNICKLCKEKVEEKKNSQDKNCVYSNEMLWRKTKKNGWFISRERNDVKCERRKRICQINFIVSMESKWHQIDSIR